MFIHRGYGTWTFLGGLMLDMTLPADQPVPTDLCGTCTACLDACPTQAIVEPGHLEPERCLVTWNIERPFHPAGSPLFNEQTGWIAGCDICQEVCPWNKFQVHTQEARFFPREGHVAFEEDDIPTVLEGTPLARPGLEGMKQTFKRMKEAG